MNEETGMPPAPDDRLRDRPFLILVTSHWLSLLGTGLVGTALISWLFVLPLQLRGHIDNPYIGIVVFIIVPVILLAGLGMVPVGVLLARRRAKQRLTEKIVNRQVAIRRLVVLGGAVTLINVVVGTQGTYRAVEHMESVQFCGQTCHVMTPEFRSHAVSPHARLQCVECHVGEGAGAGSRARRRARGSSSRSHSIPTRGQSPRPSRPTSWCPRARPARRVTGRRSSLRRACG